MNLASTCRQHGSVPYAIVCRHFMGEPPALAYFLPAMDEDPLQIWCEPCEAARLQDQGWYDAADTFAGWRLICCGCAQDVLQGVPTVIEAHDEPTPEQRSDSSNQYHIDS